MRDLFIKDWGWKLLSLILAAGIWLTVHKIIDPKNTDASAAGSTFTYDNLPVTVVSAVADVHGCRVIPAADLQLVLDNIGLTSYGTNLAVGSNATVGPADGDMMVQLNPEHKGSTWAYVRTLRRELPKEFPGVTFFFQPADMVNQVLNAGLPAPIDVQIVGHADENYAIARQLARDIARIPGARLIPLGQFPAAIPSLDRNRDIVVQCRSGARSANAVRQLQAAGFTRVKNLAGGILRWSDDVDPTVVKY